MSPKRVLLLLASAVLVGSLGGALTLGTTAAGSPTAPLVPAAPAAPAPALQAHSGESVTQPKTSLSLPTTLHLINRNTSTVTPGGHQVITAALTHKGGSAAGSAVYTCTANGQGGYNCDSAFALPGGILLAHETINGTRLSGKIIGGSGKFTGASGTVKATVRSDGKQSLTLSYTLG